MAKLNSTRFREVAKVAAIEPTTQVRYLFALRSDGTVLRRQTGEFSTPYSAWRKSKLLTTKQQLLDLVTEAGYELERSVADRRLDRIRHEQKAAGIPAGAKPITVVGYNDEPTRSDILPNECWKCRAEAEETVGFMPRIFRMMAENKPVEEVREYIDERLSVAHKSHGRSWV